MRIYLSGPMSGMHDWNREAFTEAAAYLRGQGHQVFNPAFAAPVGGQVVAAHESYMLRDLHELTEHLDGRAYYDAIAQLPGWEKSPGAKIEALVAGACGIRCFTV